MSTIHEYKYLGPKPGSLYKQLFVKGRGVRALTLYRATLPSYMEEGVTWTPEQVAEEYDVPVEAVREAIAYCESNPPEIAEDFRREERLMEATGMNHPDYKWNPKKYHKLLDPAELARILRDDEPLPG
jgi:hypothetical protein